MRIIKISGLWPILILVIQPFVAWSHVNINPSIIKQAKQSVVGVHCKTTLAAYSIPYGCTASGVVVDKQKGYILTTSTVIGRGSISAYTITFFNGTESKARVLYYDPWLDFAILKLDPSAIPKETIAVKISDKVPVEGETVFTIDAGDKVTRTLYMGKVSNRHFILRVNMPEHLISISMDVKSHVSGSLFFNKNGAGIALNCYCSDTNNFALHPTYLQYALSFLRKNKIPIRKHIGVLLRQYALDDAVRYDHFPSNYQEKYAKKFPLAKNGILVVDCLLKGSPAATKLFPGDIIWAIDGQQVGTSLVDFDMMMNKSSKDHVLLTIFRNGSLHDMPIAFYNLEQHKITRMVQFGGTTFFETDDFCSVFGGVLPKTLTFCIAQSNGIFKNITHRSFDTFKTYALQLLAVNSRPIHKLDEVITEMPNWIKQKYFTVEYINHFNMPILGGQYYAVGQNRCKANVEYDATLEAPTVWEWNPIKLEWENKPIIL